MAYQNFIGIDIGKNEFAAALYGEKAVRFFLAALAYAGIPVSRFLQPKPNGGGSVASAPKRRGRSVSRAKDPDESDDGEQQVPTPPSVTGTSRTVKLKSGGTLTVTASIDVFKLNATDRAFVFALIDKLSEYDDNRDDEDAA